MRCVRKRRTVAAARDAMPEAVSNVSFIAGVSPSSMNALAAAIAAVKATEAALAANFGNDYALNVATEAAANAASNGNQDLRDDLRRLAASAEAQQWDDTKIVRPDFFDG